MVNHHENLDPDSAGHTVSVKSNKYGYRSASDGSHPSGKYLRPRSVNIVTDCNQSKSHQDSVQKRLQSQAEKLLNFQKVTQSNINSQISRSKSQAAKSLSTSQVLLSSNLRGILSSLLRPAAPSRPSRFLDLSALQAALSEGQDTASVLQAIDQIILEQKYLQEDGPAASKGILALPVPLFSLPSRDFPSLLPLLKALGLQDYDRNQQQDRDLQQILKELSELWAHRNDKDAEELPKVIEMLRVAVAREVSKTEERKQARRWRQQNTQKLEQFEKQKMLDCAYWELQDWSRLKDGKIKAWDSWGRGGDIKMDFTSKTVKFSQLKKPEMKPVFQKAHHEEGKIQEKTLEGCLFKIHEILKEIKQLKEIKNDVKTNEKLCKTVKQVRCKPINEKIKKLQKDLEAYEDLRAKYLGVIPDYPKDSQLYGFINSHYYTDKMNNIANDQIKQEQKNYKQNIKESR